MSVALSASPQPVVRDAPIRVMVVDDAVVVRGLVSRWITEEPGLVLAAAVRDGAEAVAQIERVNPDVVVLDVDMPTLDGLSALPLLLAKKRDLVVIMSSTLTRRNAEVSLKALSLGAADYISKPETNRGITTSAMFRRELMEKVRELGRQRGRPGDRSAVAPPRRPASETRVAAVPADRASQTPAIIALRPFSPVPPKALLIGSSTGGPQALSMLVGQLRNLPAQVPILITQHMPPTFTTILAEHLARASGRPTTEPADGTVIEGGHIYLAPGGRHMRVARRNGTQVIVIENGPPINFCRPAVDPLFSSAALAWGGSALAVILTGMGSDGTNGAHDIVAAGGSVIAQDEATSVVWGMPGSVAHAGLCSAVLALDQIGPKVIGLFGGHRV